MGHVLELTEDEYTRLEAYARRRGRTPHELVAEWLASVSTPSGTSNPAEQAEPGEVAPPTEEEIRQRPLLALAGSLTLNDPRLATNFDDVLAEAIADNHAGAE
ncbi:MAG TPA: hypothetical protein VF116_09590 [Ktedonobacterales bacterium]